MQKYNGSGHRYRAIVPAAGVGLRMAAAQPKQYLLLHGRPVLRHSLEALHAIDAIESITVMIRPDDPWFCTEMLAGLDRVHVAAGGAERCDSVLLGLDALESMTDEQDWILVHDAVRPCITTTDIQSLLQTLSAAPVGGLLANPVRDTLKRVGPAGQVQETLDRSDIWTAATPQLFRYGLLRDALRAATEAGVAITDEASALEWAGYSPTIVPGRPDNLKITHPADLALAEQILAMQSDPPEATEELPL